MIIKIKVNGAQQPYEFESLLDAMNAATPIACATSNPRVEIWVDNSRVCTLDGKWRAWDDVHASGRFVDEYFRAYGTFPVNGIW